MLPRILLIGDSIRIGYAPLVRREFEMEAEIVEITENGGDSHKVAAHLADWLRKVNADRLAVIHFNCGLHDIKRPFDSTERQQSLSSYQANLQQIASYLTEQTPAQLIWATTTPVIYERHHAVKGFDRFESNVEAYNAAAFEIMQEFGIPINDLHKVIRQDSIEDCIGSDGVHMTDHGNALLAAAVTKKLRELGK